MSRCSFEKPSSEDRCLRTTSPSSSVTGRPPISISLTISALAMVDLPEPESPVKKTVKPCCARGGKRRRNSPTTSGRRTIRGSPAPRAAAGAVRCPRCPAPSPLGHLVGREVLRLLLHVDHVLEIDHLDADLGLVLLEQLLRVVGAVEILPLAVLARPGMVAPDDHVRAAVVAADDAVPDRLARAAHAHGEVQKAHRGGGGGVLVEHRLVAAHAGEVIDIAGLGHADDRVDQQVRLHLARGAEGQFLMRPVQRVAGLEGHDLAPAELAEARAQLVRRVAAGLEVVMHRRLDAGHRPAQIDRARRCRAGSAPPDAPGRRRRRPPRPRAPSRAPTCR
jgi:hypothetical protein